MYGAVVARHAADVHVEVEIQIFETNLKIVFFVFCFSLWERAVVTRRPSRHDRRRNDVFCDVEWRLRDGRDDNDVDDVESCRSENESRDSDVASSHQGHPEIRKIPTWLLPQSNSFLSWRFSTNTSVLRHNLRLNIGCRGPKMGVRSAFPVPLLGYRDTLWSSYFSLAWNLMLVLKIENLEYDWCTKSPLEKSPSIPDNATILKYFLLG